jgi:predicted SprT family Zn-dependent metalloprotease
MGGTKRTEVSNRVQKEELITDKFDLTRFSVHDQETDELAINPTMISKFPVLEVCQTIVHEMCHGWQFHFGNPSRKTYHNGEWSEKMQAIGLMPSHNGRPGGKTTGQKMMDYPMEDGRFLEATEQLINGDVFENLFLEVSPDILSHIDPEKPLFDQIHQLTIAQQDSKLKKKKKLFKYSSGCTNIWGKSQLDIICNSCKNEFYQIK